MHGLTEEEPLAVTSPVIIIGATETLAKAFAKICQQRNIFHIALTRAELNLVNPAEIAQVIERYKPWAIINAAGFVRVDDAEIQFEDCFLSNIEGPVKLERNGNIADPLTLVRETDGLITLEPQGTDRTMESVANADAALAEERSEEIKSAAPPGPAQWSNYDKI